MSKKRSIFAFKKALCQLLKTKNLEKIRVIEICELAEYSSMAFYQNYKDKYDLALSILKDEITMIVNTSYSAVKEGALHNYDTYVSNTSQDIFTHIKNNNDIYDCIFQNKLMNNCIDYIAKECTNLVQLKIDIQNENPNSYEYYNFILVMSFKSLLLTSKFWQEHSYDISSTELSKIYLSYVKGLEFSSNIDTTNGQKLQVKFYTK